MFWPQGASRANTFLGRSIFGGAAPALSQADTECEGDVCFVVASRLDKAGSTLVHNQIADAVAFKPSCISGSGTKAVADSVASKVNAVVLGTSESAALTQSEADFVTKLQVCAATIVKPSGAPDNQNPATQQPTVEPKILGIPQTPFLIGAGALGLIGLVAALARR
jgi:hypothetical protein